MKRNRDETIKGWEKYREKKVDKSAMIEATLKEGGLFELAVKHEGARVVQTMIRCGSESQRSRIATDLGPRFVELAKLPYARHVAIAMVKYCKLDYSLLQGDFVKLATHSTGARVADAVLTQLQATSATRAMRKKLMAEFYGAPSLKEALETTRRPKKLLATLAKVLERLFDKVLVHYAYAHDLLYEYTQHADFEARPDAIPHLLSSRKGALAACRLLTKKGMKSLKGKLQEAACHKHAYLFVWRSLQLDDTVFTAKFFQEMYTLDVVTNPRGSKILQWLLGEVSLDADETEVLSKGGLKDDATKKKEVLQRSPKLNSIALEHTEALMASRPGAAFVKQLILFHPSDDLIHRVVAVVTQDPKATLDHDVTHAALKTLLLQESKLEQTAFGDAFASKIDIAHWASLSNRGAFVIDALLTNPNTDRRPLKKLKLTTKGAEAIHKRLSSS